MVHYSHNSGCCRRSVAPWIAVLSLHTVFTRGVMFYKFTLVWYSAKHGAQHRPPSHLVHLHTVPFLRLREEHSRQQSCDGDFAGQCWLWWLLSRTFVLAELGLPTNLGAGWSWLFSASSIKFLTRRRWRISVKTTATHSGELSLLMCGASPFFTPSAGPTKGWIFVFLPWGGPQVGNPPLAAACPPRLLLRLAIVVVFLLLLQNR